MLQIITTQALAACRLSAWILIVLYFQVCTSGVRAQELAAERLYGWDFRAEDDANLDQWPDGWQRRRDRQHPGFIKIGLAPRNAAEDLLAREAQFTLARIDHAWHTGRWDGNYIPEVIPKAVAQKMDRYVFNNCVTIQMDGSAAELISPKFPLEAEYAYSMSAEVAAQALGGHRAYIELQLLDEQEQIVGTLTTPPISGSTDWQFVETEVSRKLDPALTWGRLHIKVEPNENLVFTGEAFFDSIYVYRLPRLSLTTPLTHHLARPGEAFQVSCAAMGITNLASKVAFELRDWQGKLVREEAIDLLGLPSQPAPETSKPADPSTKSHLVAKLKNAINGVAHWDLKIDEPGLYSVQVRLGSGRGEFRQRKILVGVLDPKPLRGGPFGWSIPEFGATVQPEDVPKLVEQFGAGVFKFPVWFDYADIHSADNLVSMVEQLQNLGVICVGRFDRPPPTQLHVFGDGPEANFALSVFRNPELWVPHVEPVLTRMGLKMNWFQLGADDDLSFMSHPDLTAGLTEIRRHMQAYSQDLSLALAWTWVDPLPQDGEPAWNAISYQATPPLSAEELATYAQSVQRKNSVWININPLSRSDYSLPERVKDLVERMIVVKQTNLMAAFVNDPFNSEDGLFDEQRNLTEMLIPWYSLVASIGEAEFIGSISMPNGSQNYAFDSAEGGVMILWNESPTSEGLYLGKQVTAIDVWGRNVEVVEVQTESGRQEQRIEVGTMPIIVRGVNADVIRWRQSFEVKITNLASTIAIEQALPFELSNTFPQAVSGTLRLYSPTLLPKGNFQLPIQLMAQATEEKEFTISVRSDASAGTHRLRFDFDIVTDIPHQFSVYREIALGTGDVIFSWRAMRNQDSFITLEWEVLNNTPEAVSFDCKVFPAGLPYSRFQVVQAMPGTTTRKLNLPIPQGNEGEIWIRCEEIGTGRILNYRVQPP
ncbi:hypothetical protein Q31a_26460 [Aureliella helgolandensis]|uniref:Uncharacterized protein n=2 Tax=Aureliella helgolandensis TaxID=2527968 RepID=A0A518G6W5_9BACT|nr:hypothetical protein Q31a_26460 [Aureliella helgolandensis]